NIEKRQESHDDLYRRAAVAYLEPVRQCQGAAVFLAVTPELAGKYDQAGPCQDEAAECPPESRGAVCISPARNAKKQVGACIGCAETHADYPWAHLPARDGIAGHILAVFRSQFSNPEDHDRIEYEEGRDGP